MVWVAEWLREAPLSPNNVTCTFCSTVHLLPKDLRFEQEGAKLPFCPRRHVNRVTPLTWLLVISNIKCCNKYNNQAESYREGAGSIIALAPNRCGGAKKSKQCHKYFPQCNTFASERPQVWTWGAKLASFHFHAFHSQCCRMLVQKKAQCPRKTSPKNTKLTQITAKKLR